ncbi:MAG TPA: OB-fold domain-containing protein [Spongiibacteraceae bacterium]|jgi:hypothetical protein
MNDDDFFWEGVDQEKLLAQQCSACNVMRHPPSPMCPRCHSLQWHAVQLSGRGRVYAWLISKHPSQPDVAPRTAVLVDLEEGLRIISNIDGGGDIEIGAPVEVVFRDIGGNKLPQFRRTGASQ